MEYTKEELDELKEKMGSFTSMLPTNLTGYVWENYKKISGNITEPKPCMCKSSGGLWAKAVNTIREYLKNIEE